MNHFPQVTTQEICLRCKGCCRFNEVRSVWRPRVARSEQIAIDLKDKLDSEGYILAEPTGHCIKCAFLNLENHHCSVYPMRPIECLLYPFLILREGSSVVMGLHLSCPYVQEEGESSYFQQKIEDVKEFCLDGGFLSFINENPEMVSDYSQYLNEIKTLFAIIE